MRRNRGQPAPFWGRLRAALAAGALAVVVGALAAAPTATAQPSSNQAGLVVLHGDGRVVTACVPFDEPEISGMALLQRSGLELNIDAGSGTGTVCRIDGEGCTVPQESCFCRCEGASCTYWSYWRTGAAGWDYSNLGAGSAVVRPGDVQGWVWGQGQAGDAAHPPALTLADICQAAAAETPTGTPSETPSGTPTPVPSATAMPLSTSTPPPLSAPPRIELFVADRLNLAAGETVTLQWRVANAAAVLLHAGGQAAAVDAAGTAVLGPLSSVEVRLEASNTSGVVNSVLLLSVAAPPQAPAVPSPPAPPAAPARQVGAVQGPTPTLSAAATATATATATRDGPCCATAAARTAHPIALDHKGRRTACRRRKQRSRSSCPAWLACPVACPAAVEVPLWGADGGPPIQRHTVAACAGNGRFRPAVVAYASNDALPTWQPGAGSNGAAGRRSGRQRLGGAGRSLVSATRPGRGSLPFLAIGKDGNGALTKTPQPQTASASRSDILCTTRAARGAATGAADWPPSTLAHPSWTWIGCSATETMRVSMISPASPVIKSI